MIDPTAQFDSDERLYAAEINLEPCPFCGSKDLSLENLVDDDDYGVSCNKCHIQQISNYTKAEAAQRWNRRIHQRKQSNGAWRCQECGEMYDLTSPAWRWDGDKWQHNHGPHMGHVNANYFADARPELAPPAQEHPDTARQKPPNGCYCGDICMAPKIMGQQTPCLRSASTSLCTRDYAHDGPCNGFHRPICVQRADAARTTPEAQR